MARVLIVDDDAETCELMTRFLRTFGHEGEYVTSGGGALARLKNDVPDLIILDVMMPGMDGEAVLRRVRNDRRTKHLSVIAYSAIDDPKYIAHLLEEGANDYWIKGSTDLKDLGQRIARCLPGTAAPVPRDAAAGSAGGGSVVSSM